MRTRITLMALATLTIAAIALAQTTQVKKPTMAEPAKATEAAVLGHADSVKWSATTYEAAATEANKKVLESGKMKRVTGEVVDVSCYLQLGKRGEAHVACGTKCLQNNQPIGIVDSEDKLYIVMAEEHHPRRDGTVDLRKNLIPLLAKTVTATGMETENKGVHALYLQAAEIDSMTSRMGGH